MCLCLCLSFTNRFRKEDEWHPLGGTSYPSPHQSGPIRSGISCCMPCVNLWRTATLTCLCCDGADWHGLLPDVTTHCNKGFDWRRQQPSAHTAITWFYDWNLNEGKWSVLKESILLEKKQLKKKMDTIFLVVKSVLRHSSPLCMLYGFACHCLLFLTCFLLTEGLVDYLRRLIIETFLEAIVSEAELQRRALLVWSVVSKWCLYKKQQVRCRKKIQTISKDAELGTVLFPKLS